MVASWFLSETGPAAIFVAALGLSERSFSSMARYFWSQISLNRYQRLVNCQAVIVVDWLEAKNVTFNCHQMPCLRDYWGYMEPKRSSQGQRWHFCPGRLASVRTRRLVSLPWTCQELVARVSLGPHTCTNLWGVGHDVNQCFINSASRPTVFQ